MKNPLIVIAGPTASGKTTLSVELAKKINGEIISADSMQVYRHMDIGTAKITGKEMQGIKHHLINILEPDEPFNIHIFQKLAKQAIYDIQKRGKIPILVGGTGFYIQSIIYDIDFDDTETDSNYRNELQNLAKEKGNTYLHQMLRNIDPISYNKIHPNNKKRVIRALEYYEQTKRPISEHNEEEMKKETPYQLLFYVLNMKRELLYKRIDERVDFMFEQGLIDEVIKLKNRGYDKNLTSMMGLGYKEILDYLDNCYSIERAQYLIKRDTRHFAKRQLTWFRHERNIIWLNVDEYQFILENILSKIIKDIEVIGIL